MGCDRYSITSRTGCRRTFWYAFSLSPSGAAFLAYSSTLSKTYATLAITRMLHHLRDHGVPLAQVEVRTDL
ncbi:MAG: hypothetical protein LBK99_17455, partial [Opitutaceae bacterium]|nr:hypothetical protein [Opitutaceae bacterium]